MKLNSRIFNPLALIGLCASLLWMSACNQDNDGGDDLANELTITGSNELSVVEKDTTVTVTYEFVVPARQAGELTINATVEDLTHGTNYSTQPAEDGGVITVSFPAEAATVSFQIDIIDDNENLPDGKVTFTLSEVTGENSTIAASAATFTLTILDNEGESITPDSEETTELGEVVPGSESPAKEVTFTTLNVVSDIAAEASEGFVVAASVDGEYAASGSLSADATSFFVKAAPDAAAALGELSGTVTLTAGDEVQEFAVSAIVSNAVGELFWIENFDYPVDDSYPSYGDNGFSGALVPTSARFRLKAPYNGSDASVAAISGLERTGVFDTWYNQVRLRGIAMGDNPLNFTGYPGSGVGRTMKVAKDGSNQNQRGNNCEFEPKNAAVGRRFVDNGSEITEGNVYLSTMIKVNAVYPDEEGKTLKQAILMLTGDEAFVNINAMKLNVREDGSGGFNFGVSKSSDDGSVVYGSTSYTLGTTYAVVMKVAINEDLAGDDPNDVVSLYVFEEGETIPSFEDPELTAEAEVNQENQGDDVHDVTTGLETVFIREVADAWAAGYNIDVQEFEISGLRIATSWASLWKDASEALYDSESEDELQILRYGHQNCGGLGNKDI